MTNSPVGYVGAVPVYLSLVICHWSFLLARTRSEFRL